MNTYTCSTNVKSVKDFYCYHDKIDLLASSLLMYCLDNLFVMSNSRLDSNAKQAQEAAFIIIHRLDY